jgi:hypothetical protein
MTEGGEAVDQHTRHVAAALGLSIIGPFAHGTFRKACGRMVAALDRWLR